MIIAKRGSTYHLRRRAPRRYRGIEQRETVWISLHTDSEMGVTSKVDRAWSQMIEAWEARLAGIRWTRRHRPERVAARPSFRADGGVPLEAGGPDQDSGLGRDRTRPDLQAVGGRQLHLAKGSGWDDATVAGAVRGALRRAGLAAGNGPAGAGSGLGRVRIPHVLLGTPVGVRYDLPCRRPLIQASSRPFRPRCGRLSRRSSRRSPRSEQPAYTWMRRTPI